MRNLAYLSLAGSLLAATSMIAFAAPGEGSPAGGAPALTGDQMVNANSKRVAYIVHKEGEAATIELSPSGRVLTESFEMPEWADNGLVLAQLAERNHYYQTRLGAEIAEPIVGTNIINYEDLKWVALDDDGNEIELLASDEYRQNVLATTLNIDLETGDIDAAITDHYLDRDSKGYTLSELADRTQMDEHFGQPEAAQSATAKG